MAMVNEARIMAKPMMPEMMALSEVLAVPEMPKVLAMTETPKVLAMTEMMMTWVPEAMMAKTMSEGQPELGSVMAKVSPEMVGSQLNGNSAVGQGGGGKHGEGCGNQQSSNEGAGIHRNLRIARAAETH